jgi:hypothetical protein
MARSKFKSMTPPNGGGGVTYPSSRLQQSLGSLYCVAKDGTSWTLMTGGGFHLPVSASVCRALMDKEWLNCWC